MLLLFGRGRLARHDRRRCFLLWAGDYSTQTIVTAGLAILVFWALAASSLRHRIVFPLQTMANLLEALRESDFSFRARGARRDDPLGETLFEINALADTLRDERLGSLEATALLRTVMAEIDVAVFAFDDEHELRLVNRAGERLLGRPAEQLMGRTAEDISLAACLDGSAPRVLNIAFPGGSGQWQVRRGSFRQGGLPHTLVVLSDVNVPLRQQEREAWHRLIRVLGHELNNSLAPIKSIAGSLDSIAAQDPMPARLARGHAARARHHRRAHRCAQPFHDGVHGARAAAAAEHARGRFVGARRAGRAAGDAKDHSDRARARPWPSRPIPISSSSC